MKETLSTYQVADALVNDEYAGWTRAGALALAKYLEQLEDDLGEEFELDVVALRCEYSEFISLYQWAKDYFSPDQYRANFSNSFFNDDEQRDIAIENYIEDQGTLIPFDGGILVSSF